MKRQRQTVDPHCVRTAYRRSHGDGGGAGVAATVPGWEDIHREALAYFTGFGDLARFAYYNFADKDDESFIGRGWDPWVGLVDSYGETIDSFEGGAFHLLSQSGPPGPLIQMQYANTNVFGRNPRTSPFGIAGRVQIDGGGQVQASLYYEVVNRGAFGCEFTSSTTNWSYKDATGAWVNSGIVAITGYTVPPPGRNWLDLMIVGTPTHVIYFVNGVSQVSFLRSAMPAGPSPAYPYLRARTGNIRMDDFLLCFGAAG